MNEQCWLFFNGFLDHHLLVKNSDTLWISLSKMRGEENGDWREFTLQTVPLFHPLLIKVCLFLPQVDSKKCVRFWLVLIPCKGLNLVCWEITKFVISFSFFFFLQNRELGLCWLVSNASEKMGIQPQMIDKGVNKSRVTSKLYRMSLAENRIIFFLTYRHVYAWSSLSDQLAKLSYPWHQILCMKNHNNWIETCPRYLHQDNEDFHIAAFVFPNYLKLVLWDCLRGNGLINLYFYIMWSSDKGWCNWPP